MNHHPSSCGPLYNLKPFLKWAGGKQRLLPELRQILPAGQRLIEPFLGAGSVFLGTDYPEYFLGDANPDLMAVWVALKSNPRGYVERAESLFCDANRSPEAYARLRHEFNSSCDRLDRAALLLYLNRFGFNGIFRVNSKGEMNTPYGKPQQTPSFPSERLEQASYKLQRAQLHIGGFGFLLTQAGAGDVVYCDPPYSDVGQSSFTAYTGNGFGVREHQELVCQAWEASRRGAYVAISNHDTPHTRALYTGCEIHQLEVRRSIAAKTSARTSTGEVLAVFKPLRSALACNNHSRPPMRS